MELLLEYAQMGHIYFMCTVHQKNVSEVPLVHLKCYMLIIVILQAD